MEFRTQFQSRERVFASPGSRIKPVYSPVYDDNGVLDLEQTGQENLYDYIQSHKDSVDIHKILQKFENGDVTVLSKVQGVYGDFTQLPATYAEALNAVISAEQTFNSLPVETRAKFNHSFSQFLAKSGSPEWLAAMGIKAASSPVAECPPSASGAAAAPAAGADAVSTMNDGGNAE